MYNEKVMDHFENPRNHGEIADADGIGEVVSPDCGDVLKLYLVVEDDVIVDVRCQTFGCGAAIAASSMATELIRGKTLEEAWQVSDMDVVRALDGLPPKKEHCSVLAEEAIHLAINDYRVRQGLEPWDDVVRDLGHEHEDGHEH